MKILHFSSAKTWRGGEQQIAYLLSELRTLNIEQVVLCVENSAMASFCNRENFTFTTYKKRAAIAPGPARKMAQLIKKEKIDLVHIHDAHAHTFACIGISFFGAKVSLVLSRRVDFPIKPGRLSSWKYNHPSIKAIVCVSNFIKRVIQKDIQNPAIIKVVHSGIDLNKFSFKKNTLLKDEFDIPATSPLIANVAAIAPHKDYFTFVDTAELILRKRPEARFLIIGGDGGEATKIRALIEDRQLSEQIQFTGFRTNIPEILPGIDVFLFTSKEEGLGTSLLDALACKVPVVATRAGGAIEIIEHEKTGLLSDIKSPSQLAAQVLRILNDRNLSQQLIKNGQHKIKSFTKLSTAQQTLKVYKNVLNLI